MSVDPRVKEWQEHNPEHPHKGSVFLLDFAEEDADLKEEFGVAYILFRRITTTEWENIDAMSLVERNKFPNLVKLAKQFVLYDPSELVTGAMNLPGAVQGAVQAVIQTSGLAPQNPTVRRLR